MRCRSLHRLIVGVFILMVLGALCASPGRLSAQDESTDVLESELFGLTIAWDETWEVDHAYAESGIVWLGLYSDNGILRLRAAPAFGGNEEICLASLRQNLEDDPSVDDIGSVRSDLALPFGGGSSSHLGMSFTGEDDSREDWDQLGWCMTLQPGYSALYVELLAPTARIEDALRDVDGIVIDRVDVPAPEFSLDETRDDLTSFWTLQFRAWSLEEYAAPSYVEYSENQETWCGSVAVLDIGPHYCWDEVAVFIDAVAAEDFELRYGTSANFFFLAHETGHHVQSLLDMDFCAEVQCLTEITDRQLELMADCFAGAWMASAVNRGILVVADVEDVVIAIADSFGGPYHGDGTLRIWWLLQGYHFGADMCFSPETEAT